MESGKLIILTGKTASGKDTVKSSLLHKYPNLIKLLTTTSRTPRERETDGVDYRFLTREEFEEQIKNNDFAEYVEYGGNLYGTEKKELENALTQDVLWKIDPFRAGEAREFIKRAFPESIAQQLIDRMVVIYINTSDEVILQRLEKRGLSQEEIQKRMQDDKKIWEQNMGNYDHVIENIPGKLNETINRICEIIENKKNGKKI